MRLFVKLKFHFYNCRFAESKRNGFGKSIEEENDVKGIISLMEERSREKNPPLKR